MLSAGQEGGLCFCAKGVELQEVTLLEQRERARLDIDRLNDLYVQLGQRAAEDVICRALRELAVRMANIETLHRQGEIADMRKCARSLGAIAEQLGMTVLARVARDVAACADAGDHVAQAATLGRLVRVGEASLNEIWELHG